MCCISIHFILSKGLIPVVADPTAQLSLHLFDFHELRRGGFHAIQIDACDIGATLCFQFVGSVVDNTFNFMQLLSGRLRGLFRIPGIADDLIHPPLDRPN